MNMWRMLLAFVALFPTPMNLGAGCEKPPANTSIDLQADLREWTARRDHLAAEIKQYESKTDCPSRARLPLLRERHQEAVAQLAAIELDIAFHVKDILAGCPTEQAIERLRQVKLLEASRLELIKLANRPAIPATQRRRFAIDIEIAKARSKIARLDVDELKRWPPGVISEAEYRNLLKTAREADRQLKELLEIQASRTGDEVSR